MLEALTGVSPPRKELPVLTPLLPASRAFPEAVQGKHVSRSDGGVMDAETSAAEPISGLFSKEQIDEILRQMNLTFDLFEIQAHFTVGEEHNEIQVVLLNTRTGEVVRRIPPGEFQQNFDSFKDGIGLLFNRIF